MNDAELVKSKIDIVEIVGGYVELKKAGKDYKARSPFRDEKTASFFVSPDKQIWHDFGASEGGDVISFVMRAEGISFPEALEMLAQRAGVTLSKQSRAPRDDRSRLYELVELAVKFYHLQLSQSPSALAYIKDQRGIKAEAIKAFTLGYASEEWSSLTDYAMKRGYTLDELKLAGLSTQKAGRKSGYDVFRDRIMFPVYDARGRAVGFSGRLLGDAKAAKYINSSDTPIYHKTTAIFGLKQAKKSIRTKDEVIIVEGHLDVLSVWQAGYEQVVAVSGTALTQEQLVSLSRMANKVKLCFDQDEAGIKATQRALELGASLPIRLEVIRFDQAKDPDELIKQDPKLWVVAYEQAAYVVDYIISYAASQHDLSSGDGKKKFVGFVLPVIARLHDSVERDHYIRQIASMVAVDAQLLREQIHKQGHKNTQSNKQIVQQNDDQTPSVQASKATKRTRQEQFEDMLMEMVLAFADTRMVLQDLNISDVSDTNKELVKILIERPEMTEKQILKSLPEQADRVKMLSLRGEHEYSHLSEHERGLEAFTQVHTVQKHIFILKKRELSRQLAVAEQQGNMPAANELLKAYQRLLEDESTYL